MLRLDYINKSTWIVDIGLSVIQIEIQTIFLNFKINFAMENQKAYIIYIKKKPQQHSNKFIVFKTNS